MYDYMDYGFSIDTLSNPRLSWPPLMVSTVRILGFQVNKWSAVDSKWTIANNSLISITAQFSKFHWENHHHYWRSRWISLLTLLPQSHQWVHWEQCGWSARDLEHNHRYPVFVIVNEHGNKETFCLNTKKSESVSLIFLTEKCSSQHWYITQSQEQIFNAGQRILRKRKEFQSVGKCTVWNLAAGFFKSMSDWIEHHRVRRRQKI